jgi:hypothetical protein
MHGVRPLLSICTASTAAHSGYVFKMLLQLQVVYPAYLQLLHCCTRR